jgi:hypothetical protein
MGRHSKKGKVIPLTVETEIKTQNDLKLKINTVYILKNEMSISFVYTVTVHCFTAVIKKVAFPETVSSFV